jgi:RNA polymerase sigma-70 factor (ECF subfamily)
LADIDYNDNFYLNEVKSGNEVAFKSLFNQYYDGMCLYANSIVHDYEAAEEIVEDIFVYLWCNISKISILTSLKSYLYRSVHNNCLKYIDKLKTRNKHLEISNYLLEDAEILYPYNENIPLSEIIIKEIEEKAETVLQSLPDQCREIYLLNRYENLSYAEIAAKLNISVSTVKTQMGRAFQKFREILKDYIPLLIALILFR